MDATGSAAGELREMAMQTKLAIYALAVTLAAIAAAGNRERTDANGRPCRRSHGHPVGAIRCSRHARRPGRVATPAADSTWLAAIFTDHVKAAHVIRRVVLRQTAIINYVNPF
jgi:hypothetical protein